MASAKNDQHMMKREFPCSVIKFLRYFPESGGCHIENIEIQIMQLFQTHQGCTSGGLDIFSQGRVEPAEH